MRTKKRGHGIIISMLLGFCLLLPAITLIYGQSNDQQTSQEEEKEKKKEAPDSPGKKVNPGKVQTPEQTAAIRKAAEEKAKAKAVAEAKAKAEAVAKSQTNEDGEYVYTNVLLTEESAAKAAADPQKTMEYWQALKAELDKRVSTQKESLKKMQERLLQAKMNYINEPSPLRQNELQQEIYQLIEDIEAANMALLNADQELKELSDKARKAGVPPGWVR